MNALKHYYTKKERTNLYLNILILIVFIGYSISLMIKQNELGVIFLLGSILVFFATAMALKETLNFFFQKAIYQLTDECDPLTAVETMKIVRKWDLFKGYTTSFIAFSSLVYIDTEDAQALLNLFAPDNQLTQKGKDMILIKNYSLYKAYIILNNRTQMKKAYGDLIKLKDLKVKGKGLSPLYAWYDIEAEYALLTNDTKEAASILAKANTSALNHREQAQHNYLAGLIETERGNTTKALAYYDKVILAANTMSIKNKAIQRYEELNHEKIQETR